MCLLALAIAVALSASALGDVTGNDDIANAEEVSTAPGTELYGTVAADDLWDYYKFTVTGGKNIVVESNVTGDQRVYYRIYDPDGNPLVHYELNESTSPGRFNWLTPGTGTDDWWYLSIGGGNYTLGSMDYHFNVTLVDEVDIESNDEREDHVNIVPAGLSGYLGGVDTADWYRFWAGEGDVINITFNAHMGTVTAHLRLIRSDHTLMSLLSTDGSQDEGSFYTSNSTDMGWFYIDVTTDTGVGSYNFSLTLSFQDDARSGHDAGKAMFTSVDFELGVWETGLVVDWDNGDFYWFDVPSGAMVHVMFETPHIERSLTLHYYTGIFIPGENSTGYETRTIYSKDGALAEMWVMTSAETPANKWFLDIASMDITNDTSARYRFKVDVSQQHDGEGQGDAGGSETNATQVEVDTGHSGYIGDLDLMDLYKFEAGGGDVINISFEQIAGYVGLHLSDGTEVLWNATSAEDHWWEASVPTPGGPATTMYYFGVSYSGDIASYNFSLTLSEAPNEGGDCQDATSVQPGENSDYIGGGDETDFWKFPVNPLDSVEVTITWPGTSNLLAQLWDACDGEIVDSMNGTGTIELSACVPSTWTPGDNYYLLFGYQGMSAMVYTFTVDVTGQDDAGSGGDADADCSGALELTLNFAGQGMLGCADMGDHYKFEVDEAHVVEVSVNSPEEVVVQLLDACGGEILDSMNDTGEVNIGATAPLGWPAGGYMYLYVAPNAAGPIFSYYMNISVSDEPVDIRPPEVNHTPPEPPREDQDLVINATVDDEDENVTVILYYRMSGETEWNTLDMTSEDGSDYMATIPEEELSEGTLEYYIEATDGEGNQEVVQSGELPINLEIKKKEDDEGSPGLGALAALACLGLAALLASSRRRR